MNLVDSSGWVEYFADGPNANFFASSIENVDSLLVPTICIFEVFKHVLRERGEVAALQTAMLMKQGYVVDLDTSLALNAAKLGHELKMPLADSVILATARSNAAVIWTQDADFKGLPSVRYRKKR